MMCSFVARAITTQLRSPSFALLFLVLCVDSWAWIDLCFCKHRDCSFDFKEKAMKHTTYFPVLKETWVSVLRRERLYPSRVSSWLCLLWIPQLLLVAYGEHRDNGLFRCVRGKADLLLLAVADREVNNELMMELLVVMGHVWLFGEEQQHSIPRLSRWFSSVMSYLSLLALSIALEREFRMWCSWMISRVSAWES